MGITTQTTRKKRKISTESTISLTTIDNNNNNNTSSNNNNERLKGIGETNWLSSIMEENNSDEEIKNDFIDNNKVEEETSLMDRKLKFMEKIRNEGEVKYPLPSHFIELEKAFQAMENYFSIKEKKKGRFRFDEIQTSVENLTKRNFTQTKLKQILTTYPDAYIYLENKDGKIFLQRKTPSNYLDKIKFMEKRKNDFHNQLFNIVKEKHLVNI